MGPDTIWAVAGVLVPGFVGVAFGLAAMTPASFRAARACFSLAAITLCTAALTWIWWSDYAYRLWVAIPVLVFAVVGLASCLRWVGLRETSTLLRDEASSVSSWDTPTSEPDVMLEISATRGSGADLYAAVPIIIYNATDVVAVNVQIEPFESGAWRAGYYGGDADTPAGPILQSTTLVFELVPHIQGNTRTPVFPQVASRNLLENMLRETGGTLGLWWLLERVTEHRKHVALIALPADASSSDHDTTEAAAGREPFEVPLRVTYWNRQLTRQWERVELLHYNPVTHRATIKQHGPPVRLTAGGASIPPSHELAFEQLRGANVTLTKHNLELKARLDAMQPRRLTATQASGIAEFLRNGLAEFAHACRINGWTTADQGVAIELTAIGEERETANYRDDFRNVFEAAGFFIQLRDSVISAPDTTRYVGAVTVLAESQTNTIRPLVIEALRSAGVSVKEGGFSVRHQMYRTYEANLDKHAHEVNHWTACLRKRVSSAYQGTSRVSTRNSARRPSGRNGSTLPSLREPALGQASRDRFRLSIVDPGFVGNKTPACATESQ